MLIRRATCASPVPDERQIRVGPSGNPRRCTGYVGIVRAVRAVIDQRRQRGIPPVPGGGRRLSALRIGQRRNGRHLKCG
jgi:carbon-monoxide dehydrogenase small subunit